MSYVDFRRRQLQTIKQNLAELPPGHPSIAHLTIQLEYLEMHDRLVGALYDEARRLKNDTKTSYRALAKMAGVSAATVHNDLTWNASDPVRLAIYIEKMAPGTTIGMIFDQKSQVTIITKGDEWTAPATPADPTSSTTSPTTPTDS